MKNFRYKSYATIFCLQLLFACCNTDVFSQAPAAMSYQAVARDQFGNILANQHIRLRFSVHDSIPTGPVVFSQIIDTMTNALGLISVNIYQAVTSTTGIFNPAAWNKFGSFMQVEMDADESGIFVDMGTQQILSVPFALFAEKTTPGSVVYMGTWNALTNDPVLSGSVGNKGDYYVVLNASSDPSQNTSLNGIDDWGTGDWAIYNGIAWEKVDNSEAPVVAQNVAFTPGSNISSTNVQDAIEELSSAKVNKAGDTMIGDLILNANPSSSLGAATKQYADAINTALQTQVNTKVNKAGDTMTGLLFLSGNPTTDLGAATKQYVDAINTALQTQVNTKVNKAGDTMTGDLILNANPSSSLGATTKQYADAINTALQTQVNTKVSKNGDTMTGHLILNANPSSSLGAATKQYVDSGDVARGAQFSYLLDSYIHQTDDGVYIYKGLAPGPLFKRFGIGITTPEAPLGIKGEPVGNYDLMSLSSSDESQKWNINLNPTSSVAPGLSIVEDRFLLGLREYRFFIQKSTGYIGIGTINPSERLEIRDSISNGFVGIKIHNAAATTNLGWSIGHIHDALDTRKDGALALDGIRIDLTGPRRTVTILPSGNVGISEELPDVKLHVSRPLSEPEAAIDLIEGTGIVVIGPITDNIVFDYRGIQARHGEYISTGLELTASELNLQRLGGNILIHGSSTLEEKKIIIRDDGKIGIGTITPLEKLHIQGANDGGDVSLQIENSSSGHNGWLLSSLDDNVVSKRAGAFGIIEKAGSTNIERITVLPKATIAGITHYNVGINEQLPYATLHVTRPVADPNIELGLAENTGILLLGPIDDKNLALDNHQIQARTGSYPGGGSSLSFVASSLGLQPRGGDILVHGLSTIDKQVVITNDGLVGLGKTPAEKLDINGAISIGDSPSLFAADGTIRWNGSDFEGRKGGVWKSLTAVESVWSEGVSAGAIYYEPVAGEPKVGIGTTTPSAQLEVSGKFIVGNDRPEVAGASVSGLITNQSSTSSTSSSYSRIGLEIKTQQEWSSNAAAKNIGIYVSEVSGQAAAESNIGALINGSVVIGDVSSSKIVGTNGSNVLAIQNGTPPTSPPSSLTANGGIQIYSDDLTGVSILHIMNGNGEVIKFYRESALTAASTATVAGGYDLNEQGVINNLRIRLNELESKLQNIGLLH